MEALPLYLLLGAGTGLLAGLFGIGGGLVIVPALVFIWGTGELAVPTGGLMHMAIGTSLAAIVFTAIASILGHQRRGAILWAVWARLAPGIVAGTAFGAWLAAQVDSEALRLFFAVFMLLVAAQTGLGLAPSPGATRGLPGTAGTTAAGGGIGLISALVGIGGGTMTTPMLMYCGQSIRNAIATSAACGLPIAVTGAVGYVVMGAHMADLPPATMGYVHWPAAVAIGIASIVTAPLGAHLTHVLPVGTLKRLFALLLVAVALRLMLY